MPNKKTRVLTKEQYELVIDAIRQGFTYNDSKGKTVKFKANVRMSTALVLQANIGLRIGDIMKLTLNNFIKDGNRHRLDIIEEKTGKSREFTVHTDIYNYIKMYCLEHSIKPTARMFSITERALQKNLQIVCNHLQLEGISTHSFRKFYATSIYMNNECDVALVQQLLQHSSIAITQKYIGISSKKVEQAIQRHLCLL